VNRPPPANPAASIRQRLLNRAQARGEDFGQLLIRYASERFLVRLAASPHADHYVLKGAQLFAVWSGLPHRPTRDIDLAGRGDASPGHLEGVMRTICTTPVAEDGMRFEPGSIRVTEIREAQSYGGLRARLLGLLGVATVWLQVDVGFGDAIVPRPQFTDLPTLLGGPRLRLQAYPREAVVAEKAHAMVVLGMANSRMKDFFDLYTLARNHAFTGDLLVAALRGTFGRRGTMPPEATPLALTPEFAVDIAKRAQWAAFVQRIDLATPPGLDRVVQELRRFLEEPLAALSAGEPFPKQWSPEDGWTAPVAPSGAST
jgi:hypothetical protein